MKVRRVGILLLIFTSINCTQTQRLCVYTLNPDTICRTCDLENKGRKIVEYFNSDTNDLRLFIVSNGNETEINHPLGLMDGVHDKINSNKIKFDPADSTYLLVNEKRFLITPK